MMITTSTETETETSAQACAADDEPLSSLEPPTTTTQFSPPPPPLMKITTTVMNNSPSSPSSPSSSSSSAPTTSGTTTSTSVGTTRNYLIDLLSQASLAIKYDLRDNQIAQAKKLYQEVALKFSQLSPFIPQQYSKVLNKYSKLYQERANHLSSQLMKLNQQEQFNTIINTYNNNNNNSTTSATSGGVDPASANKNVNINVNMNEVEDNFVMIENTTNSNSTTGTTTGTTGTATTTANTANSNNNNSNSNNNSSNGNVSGVVAAASVQQQQQQPQPPSKEHSLSSILSNHKKIKKSVKELNSELHDFLYPNPAAAHNKESMQSLLINNLNHSEFNSIIFNDKFQFIEEEIPINDNSNFSISNYGNCTFGNSKNRHLTFWLIKKLSLTMLNGGFLFPNLYISKKVWFQPGAKLFNQLHKINFCQKLSDLISEFKTSMLIQSKNGKDIKLVEFGNVIYNQDLLLNQLVILQKELVKNVNLVNVGGNSNTNTNQPFISDNNLFNLFVGDDEEESNEVNSSSDNTGGNTTGNTSANNNGGNSSFILDSSSISISKVFGFGKSMFKTLSNTIKGNKEETSERPYVPWLIQVFNNLHFIDDWITIYEDLYSEFSNSKDKKSKIREIEELKLILERFERMSLMLHSTLLNFVIQDLQILLERFVIKSSDSLAKLFAQKNAPIL